MCEGRFVLGVGSGEALNEQIFGDPWPGADVRLEMLEEAVEVMRELWSGGFVDHRGRHYTVEHARIYTQPENSPPVYVSGFGPNAIGLAARIGDGYISTAPAGGMVAEFRAACRRNQADGREAGGANKPAQGAFKACFAPDPDEATRIAHQKWASTGLPGELSQVLPSPPLPAPLRAGQRAGYARRDPEQGGVRAAPGGTLEKLEEYAKAGFDEVYVANIGPHWEGFLQLYATPPHKHRGRTRMNKPELVKAIQSATARETRRKQPSSRR
jgi:G6PDH family F420-dependent oxidoreductase